MRSCKAIELGLIRYDEALALQQRLVSARKAGAAPDVLLLCEHPHVITLGRNGKLENLLASSDTLREMGVEFHHSDRGGDVTYHGPGQLVGYPILNLSEIRRDVGWYVRKLEEVMIRTSANFGVRASRVPGRTGVWVSPAANASGDTEEKLGAIGVHLSRWVTSHGFAYNVSADLRYFDLIVPCGIANRRATSLEKLLGRTLAVAECLPAMVAAFGDAFEMDMASAQPGQVFEEIQSSLAQPPTMAGTRQRNLHE
jgi:lipoyl(octanoyl) transferase